MSIAHRITPINDPSVTHFAEGVYSFPNGPQTEFMATSSGYTDGAIAQDIFEGQIGADRIARILAVNPATGTVCDVTREIGELVYYIADANPDGFDRLPEVARDLIERAGFDLDAVLEDQAAQDESWSRQIYSTLASAGGHL